MMSRVILVHIIMGIALAVQVILLSPGQLYAESLLAAGMEHAMAVLADGQVVSWGDNESGQLGYGKTTFTATPLQISFPARIALVSASGSHVLALDVDGNVWSWGSNDHGQIGDGTTIDRSLPAIVFRGATRIAASEDTSLVIDSAGKVWEWGNCNWVGLPGILTPRSVTRISSASQIFTSFGTRLVIDQSGALWAWGHGSSGKLGNGEVTQYRETPTRVAGLPAIKQLDIGAWHVLAVDLSGQVWGWGREWSVNNGAATGMTFLRPTRLTGLPAMKQVGAGILSWSGTQLNDNYGIGVDGALYGWNNNPPQYREISTGTQAITSIFVGDRHALAIDAAGKVWGWGSNNVGQLGPDNGNDLMRIISLDGQTVKSLFASDCGLSREDASSFFVTTGGSLFALGSNRSFQLALPDDGEVTSRSVPGNIADFRGGKAAVARRNTSFSVTTDGSVYGWGENAYCQIGYNVADQCSPTTTPHKIGFPVAIRKVDFGGNSTLALDYQRRVWTVGFKPGRSVNEQGTPDLVDGVPAAIDIARGLYHSAIVASDGSVWIWGSNDVGQLGLGFHDPVDYNFYRDPSKVAGISGAVKVVAGWGFTAVLDNRGKVWVWGYTPIRSTIITTPTPVSFAPNVTNIFAGESVLYALFADGSAQSYGLYPNPYQVKSDSFQSPIREIAIGGIYTESTVYFRLADGTVRAFGDGDNGQLGSGSYVDSQQTQLVVNDDLKSFLDLDPAVPNAILPEELPPFLLEARSAGSNTSRTLSVEVNLNQIQPSSLTSGRSSLVSRSSPRYNVYVAAIVPGIILNSTQPALFTLNSSSLWGQYLGGPLPEFMQNVEVTNSDQRLLLQILSRINVSSLVGTTIYVGYGTSDTEMLQNGRYRAVYTVSDPSPPQ